jgi:cytoskeletal protein RodZ
MAEIGAMLRERRELISLTVDEVERHTHLRAVFVKALEEGAFDKLPSTVQTRGMLSNYASFLDLDVDTVLLRYADALQARRHEKYAETPREKIQTQVTPSMPVLRTFIAGDLIFGVVMIAVIVGLAIWGVGRLVSSEDEIQAQPTAPVVFELGSPAPTYTPVLTFVAVDDPSVANSGTEVVDAAATSEIAVSTSTANVVVSVFAIERVFVRISVDGELVFEGRMAPRETKLFEANDQVVVLTGDGSALRITYNGTDLGLMGGQGEVISRVYLITGVATPTATIPPTPTNTPLTTPTFTPTSTSTSTATPTATP